LKIGYLGPRGTFSFEAANMIKKEGESLIEYKTITDCILAITKKEIDKAIVPIENSIQGGVTETVDTLVDLDNVYIEDEIVLKINQNLIANKKYKFEEIKNLYSHPQALAQCRNFIEKKLHGVEILQVSSTALAAKEIKNKEFCACIANESCIKEYDLKLIERNIQDNDYNQTRFWILSTNLNKIGDKMSLIFSTKDKPGALYHVLEIFNRNNINLVKIESRPAKTVLGEYIFLVDLEVNENIDTAIKTLVEECQKLKILGRY